MKKLIKFLTVTLVTTGSLFMLTACNNNENNKQIEKNKSEKVEEKQINLGKWEGNTYTNDYLKVKYEMPSNWDRYSDEEILEIMKIGSEFLGNNEKLAEKLIELNNISYLMSSDPNSGNNIIMMSEKLSLKNASIKFYTDALKRQLESQEAITYEFSESKEEEFAGENYTSMIFNATTNGVEMIQKYYLRKIDDYFFSIILTSTNGEDGLNQMINSISSY